MKLTIELPDESATVLKAKAREEGVPAEEYAQRILKRGLSEQGEGRLSDRIRGIWRDMPADVRAALPRDGASEIDHYVYGSPKRNP